LAGLYCYLPVLNNELLHFYYTTCDRVPEQQRPTLAAAAVAKRPVMMARSVIGSFVQRFDVRPGIVIAFLFKEAQPQDQCEPRGVLGYMLCQER